MNSTAKTIGNTSLNHSIWPKIQPYCVVLSAALFFLFMFINMNAFNVLNESIRQSFNLNALQISNLSAMYFYANVLFLIPMGLILDRYSTRYCLLIAFLIAIACTFGFAWTHSYTTAAILRFISGLCSTLCLLSTALLASRWVPSRLCGMVMGLAITMAMLGGVFAQHIDALIIALGSWRLAYSAIAMVGILLAVIAWLFVRDHPPNAPKHPTGHLHSDHHMNYWQQLKTALKNPQTYFAGLYTNFLSLPVIILCALWAKDYLVTAHALSNGQANTVSSSVFIGLIIGSPLMGWISDRVSLRKAPMAIGALLSLILILIIIYAPGLGYLQLLGLFFLLGLITGTQVISYPLIIECNPRAITASCEGLGATIIMAAGAIFQPLFGYLLHQAHNQHPHTAISTHDFQHPMLILPITFACAFVLSLLIKETHCKHCED